MLGTETLKVTGEWCLAMNSDSGMRDSSPRMRFDGGSPMSICGFCCCCCMCGGIMLPKGLCTIGGCGAMKNGCCGIIIGGCGGWGARRGIMLAPVTCWGIWGMCCGRGGGGAGCGGRGGGGAGLTRGFGAGFPPTFGPIPSFDESGMRPLARWICSIWSLRLMLARAALAVASAEEVWPSHWILSSMSLLSSSPIFLPISASWAASSPTPKISVRRSASCFKLLSIAWPGAKTWNYVKIDFNKLLWRYWTFYIMLSCTHL